MPSRFKDLCLDASDHQALADWWCAALGYVRQAEESPRQLDRPVPIEDPAGQGPLIWINPVPEPKSVKNRMHLDLIGLVGLASVLARRYTVVCVSHLEADSDRAAVWRNVLSNATLCHLD
jgi:hypothetical protein